MQKPKSTRKLKTPSSKNPSSKSPSSKSIPAAKRASIESQIEAMVLKMLEEQGPGFLDTLQDGADGEQTDLERAQDMVWKAQDLDNPAERLALARQAADLSPHCADAFMMLAYEGKISADEKYELVVQAEKAGAEALGPETFEQDAGHFWGLIETRPYMRALMALAQLQWQRGERNAALSSYRKLLHLNPMDNMGARYEFLDRLIIAGELHEAAGLLKAYKGESSAFFDYGKLLLALAQQDEAAAARHFNKARRTNNRVPDYLTGKTAMPKTMPPAYRPGHPSEAILYAKQGREAWSVVPGALAWLKKKAE